MKIYMVSLLHRATIKSRDATFRILAGTTGSVLRMRSVVVNRKRCEISPDYSQIRHNAWWTL